MSLSVATTTALLLPNKMPFIISTSLLKNPAILNADNE